MGAYINQADIETRFGTLLVAQWANFNPSTNPGTASPTRIAAAIASAEGQVNARLRNGPYTIPVSGTDGTIPIDIVDVAAELAGCWLFVTNNLHQTKEAQATMKLRYEAALKRLLDIRTGVMPLDAVRQAGGSNLPSTG